MKTRFTRRSGVRRREFLAGAAATSSLLVMRPWVAEAAKWPEKPINVVIMYEAGGGTDTIMRVLAKEMAAARGWNVEPINKPGAVGGIATNYVLSQPANGYTILGAANYNRFVRVMGHTNSKLWEDWVILQAASSIASWSVALDSPFKTFDDAVKYAKANPNKLTVSTSGTGGVWHEVALVLGDAAGIRPQFIPYKGGKPATLAGLQGETQIAGGGLHEHIDLIRAGKLRNLFHAGSKDITLENGTVLKSISGLVPSLKPSLPLGAEYNFLIKRDTPVEILREIKSAFEVAVKSAAFKEIAKKEYFEVEVLSGTAADKKGAFLEARATDIFNRYKDQIGAKVKTAAELGLPEPAAFDKWWPPKGYKPIEL